MQIEFELKDYMRLLIPLQITDWVLHAFKEKESDENPDFREFEQKMFAYAKSFGLEDLIEYSKEDGLYFPTRKFEETSPGMANIDEFTEENLWDELATRLAKRDLVKELGETTCRKLSFQAACEKLDPLEKYYSEEFEKHGLERLRIVEKT